MHRPRGSPWMLKWKMQEKGRQKNKIKQTNIKTLQTLPTLPLPRLGPEKDDDNDNDNKTSRTPRAHDENEAKTEQREDGDNAAAVLLSRKQLITRQPQSARLLLSQLI